MLRFLKAKMLEHNIKDVDIAVLIGRSTRAVRGKIAEETAFSMPEAILIRNRFFPGTDPEELFASDKMQESA